LVLFRTARVRASGSNVAASDALAASAQLERRPRALDPKLLIPAHVMCKHAQMEWGDVRYFLTLARGGSLSAAARELSVEHTTIARRVSALEASLGVRLFDRLPRGWRLTSEGRELVDAAENIERDANAFELRSRGTVAALVPVRVSAPPALVTHFFVPRLGAFTQREPSTALELIADRRGVNLHRGEADVALRIGPPDVSPGMIVRTLGTIGYGLYGVREMVRRKAPEQVFCGMDASMAGVAAKEWLDAFAATRRVVFRSNEMLALHRAACAGVGIALLPHFLVHPKDPLEQLPVERLAFERPLSLILHPDLRRARRVRAVVQFLTEAVRTGQRLLASPSSR
jgi:DNA-binding transcriptional LysR family regulator